MEKYGVWDYQSMEKVWDYQFMEKVWDYQFMEKVWDYQFMEKCGIWDYHGKVWGLGLPVHGKVWGLGLPVYGQFWVLDYQFMEKCGVWDFQFMDKCEVLDLRHPRFVLSCVSCLHELTTKCRRQRRATIKATLADGGAISLTLALYERLIDSTIALTFMKE